MSLCFALGAGCALLAAGVGGVAPSAETCGSECDTFLLQTQVGPGIGGAHAAGDAALHLAAPLDIPAVAGELMAQVASGGFPDMATVMEIVQGLMASAGQGSVVGQVEALIGLGQEKLSGFVSRSQDSLLDLRGQLASQVPSSAGEVLDRALAAWSTVSSGLMQSRDMALPLVSLMMLGAKKEVREHAVEHINHCYDGSLGPSESIQDRLRQAQDAISALGQPSAARESLVATARTALSEAVEEAAEFLSAASGCVADVAPALQHGLDLGIIDPTTSLAGGSGMLSG